MRGMLKIKLLFFCLIILSTCKKYDEGGYIYKTNKSLFGSSKIGSKKTWKLESYIVNGIDSTELIFGRDLFDKIVFEIFNKEGTPSHRTVAGNYNYSGYFSAKDKLILFSFDFKNYFDSIQCNNGICQRNIFFPEILPRNPQWHITKLTKDDFIINFSSKNDYKIILKSN